MHGSLPAFQLLTFLSYYTQNAQMISSDDWQNIDTVLLDMDGTLLDLHFDNFFWQQHLPACYAKANKLSVEQALTYLQPIFKSEYGKLHWYCLDYWQQRTGLDIASLKLDVQHLIGLRPYAIEFVQAVRAAGKQAVVVTNAHRKSVQIKMDNTGLDQHLDAIYSAHDFGAAKEDPTFWGKFKQGTGLDPKRALFIDDTITVLDAARNYGIPFTLAIEQPDSKRRRELVTTHPSIQHFDELMPL